jgi:hypothetical protein
VSWNMLTSSKLRVTSSLNSNKFSFRLQGNGLISLFSWYSIQCRSLLKIFDLPNPQLPTSLVMFVTCLVVFITCLVRVSSVTCLYFFRGRYDVDMYPSFLRLHGKSYDYKIPYTTMIRMFLLPHNDQRSVYFVVRIELLVFFLTSSSVLNSTSSRLDYFNHREFWSALLESKSSRIF